MTICGIDQTLRTHLGQSAALALESRGELGRVLAGLMRRWWDATAPDTEDFPHDAVTALLLLHPELFTFREVTLALETAGASAGRVVAHDDPGSSTRIVSDLQVAAVERRVLEHMLAAIPEDQPCSRNPA
jgi:non-specific riboncleoside hydrolase